MFALTLLAGRAYFPSLRRRKKARGDRPTGRFSMTIQTQVKQPTIANGVNVTQLMDTIGAIQGKPELASFRFRATNDWKDGTQNVATISAFYGACSETDRKEPFRFLADEPPVLCGRDEGANPVEFLLSALSMCVTTSIVAHAAARGIAIESVRSELEGDLDVRGFLGMSESVRKGFSAIRMHMRIKSDGSAETLRKLADFSPVYDVVSRSVPVELTIETL
jgi:uncharacterized OsmC-like protein